MQMQKHCDPVSNTLSFILCATGFLLTVQLFIKLSVQDFYLYIYSLHFAFMFEDSRFHCGPFACQ